MITVTITATHAGKARKRTNQLITQYGGRSNVPLTHADGLFANCIVAVAAGEKVKKGVEDCNVDFVKFRDGRAYTIDHSPKLNKLIEAFDAQSDDRVLEMLPLRFELTPWHPDVV